MSVLMGPQEFCSVFFRIFGAIFSPQNYPVDFQLTSLLVERRGVVSD